MKSFNTKLKQLSLLALILLLTFLLFYSLKSFIPGMLCALTLYTISRNYYFELTEVKKARKSWTAFGFLFFYLVVLGIPVYLVITLLEPKVKSFLSQPQQYVELLKNAIETLERRYNYELLGNNSLSAIFEKVSGVVPSLLNSTSNIVANLVIMLFLLYYMLVEGRRLEAFLVRITPLKNRNINLLVQETQNTIKANAIGIPLISLIQGITAAIGYSIFGVPEFLIWGTLTGLFAFFPMVGTMIIWVPIVIFQYANGQNWQATGLLIYSLLATGNIDTVARMTLLRRFGDVHPVITVMGVIAGLSLFGFIGLIFGPLLMSYILVLVRIYLNEFDPEDDSQEAPASGSSAENEPPGKQKPG
ncbi:MAG: AI-2E family transporter [Flavihumibacter sp.]